MKQELTFFWAAVMFYSRLPAPKGSLHSDEILNRSRKYFPLIGIIIALLSAAVYLLASQVFTAAVSLVLMMISSVLLTGAFHEDGFADTCDGFGGGWGKEQVLTIMKDSRLGTYGAIGLFGILALKLASLVALSQNGWLIFIAIYVLAHAISRLFSSLVIEFFDYVQDIDKSKVKPITDRRLNRADLVCTLIIALIPTIIAASYFFTATLLAIVVAMLTAILFANYSKKRIGGYTGDVLGAIQQITEVTIYLCFLACL